MTTNKAFCLAILVTLTLITASCELIVNFDRSLIPGPDASVDASVAAVDGGLNSSDATALADGTTLDDASLDDAGLDEQDGEAADTGAD